jgi:glycosyltransferase involved in cell wall biosynthesis
MVTTFYPPYHFGGDAVFIHRLVQALARRGHFVDVVHSVDAYRLQHRGEPDVAFDDHPGVRRHALDSGGGFWRLLAAHQLGRPGLSFGPLRSLLESGDYDVIHFHNVSLMGGPGILRLGRGIKLYTAHEYWLVCPTHVLFAFGREACTEKRCLACTLHYRRPPQVWRHTGLLERCLREIDSLLVPSAFALDEHRRGGIEAPIRILPHFVSTPEAREESAPPPGRPFFLYAGRLERLKGIEELLELFRGYREADLVVAGGGSLDAVLRERAQGLSHVRFLGPVHPEHLGALYRRALAVVVPSLCYETFGLSAAEALMNGTPVVARRIGALTEIVDQSGGGLTFSTPAECREALEQLRTRPDLRHRLGEAGRRVAEERWSEAAHIDAYLALIQEMRERRGLPNLADEPGGGGATSAARAAGPTAGMNS